MVFGYRARVILPDALRDRLPKRVIIMARPNISVTVTPTDNTRISAKSGIRCMSDWGGGSCMSLAFLRSFGPL